MKLRFWLSLAFQQIYYSPKLCEIKRRKKSSWKTYQVQCRTHHSLCWNTSYRLFAQCPETWCCLFRASFTTLIKSRISHKMPLRALIFRFVFLSFHFLKFYDKIFFYAHFMLFFHYVFFSVSLWAIQVLLLNIVMRLLVGRIKFHWKKECVQQF